MFPRLAHMIVAVIRLSPRLLPASPSHPQDTLQPWEAHPAASRPNTGREAALRERRPHLAGNEDTKPHHLPVWQLYR